MSSLEPWQWRPALLALAWGAFVAGMICSALLALTLAEPVWNPKSTCDEPFDRFYPVAEYAYPTPTVWRLASSERSLLWPTLTCRWTDGEVETTTTYSAGWGFASPLVVLGLNGAGAVITRRRRRGTSADRAEHEVSV